MRYYPVCLRVAGRRCLVIGGGRVAERKVIGLLAAGASVVVISPLLTERLQGLQEEGRLAWQPRGYQVGDVVGFFLVMAATDDCLVQDQVQREAEEHHILLNVADVPAKCNFILPAVVKRDPLSIAISTSGKSPALAKSLRRHLERLIGPDYQLVAEIMGLLRPLVMAWGLPQRQNEAIFQGLVDGDILGPVGRRDWHELEVYLETGLQHTLPVALASSLKKLLEG